MNNEIEPVIDRSTNTTLTIPDGLIQKVTIDPVVDDDSCYWWF